MVNFKEIELFFTKIRNNVYSIAFLKNLKEDEK